MNIVLIILEVFLWVLLECVSAHGSSVPLLGMTGDFVFLMMSAKLSLILLVSFSITGSLSVLITQL